MISADDLIENARSWVGVPFLHQGRSRYGADCLGFIAACLEELGSTTFIDYLPRAYSRTPTPILMKGLQELTREIKIESAALLTFQWPLQKFPSHAGIFTGSTIIHCDGMTARGKVVECQYQAPWVARTRSIWALPGVMYQ